VAGAFASAATRLPHDFGVRHSLIGRSASSVLPAFNRSHTSEGHRERPFRTTQSICRIAQISILGHCAES
jgi:hypothetical protein